MEEDQDLFEDACEDSAIELIAMDGKEAAPLKNSPTEVTDRPAILQVYLATFGDAEKTAMILNTDVRVIESYAAEENWQKKVDALRKLRAEHGADALARELNRTANFVQAIRLRKMLDRFIKNVCRKGKFEDFCTNHGKNASNISFKAPLELVKACQLVQDMTYNALADNKTARKASESEDSESNSSLAVFRMLNAGVAEPTKTIVDQT